MTAMGRIVSLYPAMILGLSTVTVLWFGWHPSIYQPLILAANIYLLPPLTLRLHQLIFPIKEGASNLSERKYSPWWGAHQIQLIYIAIPQLEALLRMVPGLYSVWLRLCGSKVGRNVYWTPNVEITDRCLMDIGDRVVFGHRTHFFAHAIKPGKRGMILYTRRIKIGDDVFIGAGSRAGPGVVIANGVCLPILTDLYIDQVVESQPDNSKTGR